MWPTIDAAADVRNVTLITSATAQARNPFAVSRKYTSSVWMSAHLVRNLPVRYPPRAEAMISIRINQTMAAEPTADADAPLFDQGDIADNPKPAPKANKIR